MVRCHVKGCGRSVFKDKNHHFFRQPKNSELRKKWQGFAQVPGSPTHLRICSDHFEPSCIRKKFPRPLLLPESIPTISPGQPSQENTNSVHREQTLTFERSALQDECSHKDKRIILDITKATAEESVTIEIQTNNKIRIVVNGISSEIGKVLRKECPSFKLCSPETTNVFINTYIKIRCFWEARFMRRELAKPVAQSNKIISVENSNIAKNNQEQKKMTKFL